MLQRQLVAEEASRQEVRKLSALPVRKPIELRGDDGTIKAEVEHGEAVRRIPSTSANPCAAARERVVPRREVAKCLPFVCGRRKPVDAGDQSRVDHELDEHALSHRVDGAEHRT